MSEEQEIKQIVEENPAVQYVARHGKEIFAAAFGVIVLILALSYFFSGDGTPQEYLKAEMEMQSLKQGVRTGKDLQPSIEKMTALLKSSPELQSKYDATLAQILIALNKSDEALPLAKRALKRSDEQALHLYHDFGTITLLIEEGKIEQARTHSLALKDQLQGEAKTLQLFNLLRIAALNQTLGDQESEQLAWKELQSLITSSDASEIQGFTSTFSEGELSIHELINAHIKS